MIVMPDLLRHPPCRGHRVNGAATEPQLRKIGIQRVSGPRPKAGVTT